MNRAREKLVKLAKKFKVELRQSYRRVGKIALIMHQRYAHARQFGRAQRAAQAADLCRPNHPRYRAQDRRQSAARGRVRPAARARAKGARSGARPTRPQVYSLHAPEVECIGKGKPHKPYEFGVKVSVATTLKHCKGGQFAIHAKALPGNPYDGHTLARIIPAIDQLIGNTIERLHADAGYRGHNAPPDYQFKVYTSKQKRRLTPQIEREMRRRSTIEPVIGHLKNEHRMDRNYLHHRRGDANNAILAAVGYNFRLLIRWLRILLALIMLAIGAPPQSATA
jgi:IS5 family transposase